MNILKEIATEKDRLKHVISRSLEAITPAEIERIDYLFDQFEVKKRSLPLSARDAEWMKRRIEYSLQEKIIQKHYPESLKDFRDGLLSPKIEIKVEMAVERAYMDDIRELFGLLNKASMAVEKVNYYLVQAGLPSVGEQLIKDRSLLDQLLPDIDKSKMKILSDLKQDLTRLQKLVKYDIEVMDILQSILTGSNYFTVYMKLKQNH